MAARDLQSGWRRRWLLGAGYSAVLGPFASAGRAQGAVPRVGVLYPTPPTIEPGNPLDRFRQGLRDLGLVEGRHLQLELRWDSRASEQVSRQVAELVALKVDVIVAGTTASAQVARRATTSVPIVMAVSADPVFDGLVATLARPGGNVTGMSIMSPEVTPKRLQLLAEVVPGLSRVGLLLDASFVRWKAELQEHEAAARVLGLGLIPAQVEAPEDFAPAIDAARRRQAQAMVLMQSVTFSSHRTRLAALALEHRLPSISGSGDGQFARAGGLMNYGASIPTSWYQAAHYVHRILQGARPSELPVRQPERFELAINQRTASALGLVIPQHLLLLADEVFS